MSRHRGLPRGTLSTDPHLQSPRKDMYRQHFAKLHYVDPVQPTIYINDQPRNPVPTNHVIPYDPPSHPELDSGSLSKDSVILYDPPSHPELVSGSRSSIILIQTFVRMMGQLFFNTATNERISVWMLLSHDERGVPNCARGRLNRMAINKQSLRKFISRMYRMTPERFVLRCVGEVAYSFFSASAGLVQAILR